MSNEKDTPRNFPFTLSEPEKMIRWVGSLKDLVQGSSFAVTVLGTKEFDAQPHQRRPSPVLRNPRPMRNPTGANRHIYIFRGIAKMNRPTQN